jgi:hypothetical protein
LGRTGPRGCRAAEESFEIVRRRLFKELTPNALTKRDAVVKGFGELYQRQASEFPSEWKEGGDWSDHPRLLHSWLFSWAGR